MCPEPGAMRRRGSRIRYAILPACRSRDQTRSSMQEQRPSRYEDLLALVNPPLALSAAAEALAGAYLAGAPVVSLKPWLLALAAMLLFAAASVFGHYFDRTRDEKQHPER